jgi:hypothetical protein
MWKIRWKHSQIPWMIRIKHFKSDCECISLNSLQFNITNLTTGNRKAKTWWTSWPYETHFCFCHRSRKVRLCCNVLNNLSRTEDRWSRALSPQFLKAHFPDLHREKYSDISVTKIKILCCLLDSLNLVIFFPPIGWSIGYEIVTSSSPNANSFFFAPLDWKGVAGESWHSESSQQRLFYHRWHWFCDNTTQVGNCKVDLHIWNTMNSNLSSDHFGQNLNGRWSETIPRLPTTNVSNPQFLCMSGSLPSPS